MGVSIQAFYPRVTSFNMSQVALTTRRLMLKLKEAAGEGSRPIPGNFVIQINSITNRV
jgi:hypothetical protein